MEVPKAGETLILTAQPCGLLDGLVDEDERAISAMVGKPVLLCGYDAQHIQCRRRFPSRRFTAATVVGLPLMVTYGFTSPDRDDYPSTFCANGT